HKPFIWLLQASIFICNDVVGFQRLINRIASSNLTLGKSGYRGTLKYCLNSLQNAENTFLLSSLYAVESMPPKARTITFLTCCCIVCCCNESIRILPFT